jgi:repressor LexA
VERDNLSKKQKIMYDFIADFIEEHGYSPTFREIASGLNYKSLATVATHVNNLANGGWIVKTDKVGRSKTKTSK